VLERLGREYGEVRDLAYVAGNVPPAIRDPELSFSHHRVVAKLLPKDQEIWLKRARTRGWSVHELREQLRDVPQLSGGREPPASVLEQLRFTAPTERVERWRAAADRADLTFEDWMAAVLDVAAGESEMTA
jgi:hypothetical protein